RHLSVLQAKALLASVRPRDAAGRTRRALAAELIGEIDTLDGKFKQLLRRLRQDVTATGSGLMNLFGIGPAGAARIPIRRRRRGPLRRPQLVRLATGTAPLDASSGEQIRHRLSPRRQPPPEPRPLHRRDRPDPPRHPRPHLLPPED